MNMFKSLDRRFDSHRGQADLSACPIGNSEKQHHNI